MNSEFATKKTPAKRSFVKPGITLYVGNLPYDVKEADLIRLFTHYGKVRDVKLIKTPGTDKSKGIAFVKMVKKEQGLEAIQEFDGRVIGGRTVKCSEALENGEAPKKKAGYKKAAAAPKVKADKEEIAMVKRARRKTGLQNMFESIGKR